MTSNYDLYDDDIAFVEDPIDKDDCEYCNGMGMLDDSTACAYCDGTGEN